MRHSKGPRPLQASKGGVSSHTSQRFLLCRRHQGSRSCQKAFGVSDGDSLRALLHYARREVGAVTEGQWFADNAHAIAGIQLEMAGLQNFRIAYVNLHLAGSRLQEHMPAHGSSV